MQLGIVGLGRMGANIARRLMRRGHGTVVYDIQPELVEAAALDGAHPAYGLNELVKALHAPRAVWLMLPAGEPTETAVAEIANLLEPDDIIIDGGNTHFQDDLKRAKWLRQRGIHYIDVGTSGGVWGLDRGYCLMIGGDVAPVARLQPLFEALAPGSNDDAVPDGGQTSAEASDDRGAQAPPAPQDARRSSSQPTNHRSSQVEAPLSSQPAGQSRSSTQPADGPSEPTPLASSQSHSAAAFTDTASHGYIHAGPVGAGHFVKMVHNGIEYGMMQALAEGFHLLHANNSEHVPVDERHAINVADVAEVWRHGSVVSSWLLDLTAAALARDPLLQEFTGRVSDSGEGRWTIETAIQRGVPTPVLANALFARFRSRLENSYPDRLLSAMRLGFGGHTEDHRP